MTDEPEAPEGFRPMDEEPNFASAPPPDWVRPHEEEPSESSAPIRIKAEFKTAGDVQRVDRDTFEAAVETARASGADVQELTEDGATADGFPIKVKTEFRFKTKTIGPDGTVTVREADPQAAKAAAKAGAIVFSFVVAFGCLAVAALAWIFLDVLR